MSEQNAIFRTVKYYANETGKIKMYKVAFVSKTIGRVTDRPSLKFCIDRTNIRVIEKTFKTEAAAKCFITKKGLAAQKETHEVAEYAATHTVKNGVVYPMTVCANIIEWQPVLAQ